MDLDQAAALMEVRRQAWLADGAEVGPLTWRDEAETWPPTLHTDRAGLRDPDSVGIALRAGSVEGRRVFRGGWADVELGGGLGEPVIEAPTVESAVALAAVLNHVEVRLAALRRERSRR